MSIDSNVPQPIDDSKDYVPKNTYQDDFDTGASQTDPVIDEETDDPTEGFGVPPEKFRGELDRLDGDAPANENAEYDQDDMREYVEDLDENDKDRS